MQQQSQQQPAQGRQSSGRRRHKGNSNRSSARKTYASENDMPSDNQIPVDFSPNNPAIALDSMTDNPIPTSTTKPNKRNGKPRPNNVSISPGPPAPGRRTPPQTAGPKLPSGPAFAGATFHASPAPSSLPLPSFLAKTFPDSPSNPRGDVNAKGEPSPPTSDSEAPTPAAQSTANTREESPLDLFFRADRAEKERARRASSANTLSSASGPFSPPFDSRSPQYSATSPRGLADHQVRRSAFERLSSSAGISSSELNGTPGQPIGPAFSTPYQERIRAARSTEVQGQQPVQIFRGQQPHVDRSDDLKRFLFGGKLQTPTAPEAPASPAMSTGYTSDISGSPRTSATSVSEIQHAYAAASSPTPNEQGNSINLTAMEDTLRQILKLDLRGPSPLSRQS